ncbi:MAG TPA: hypothetical protein VE913_11510 [Longimicrobium sp.]|nr:hypothetical protein [Longimicrobium sp.]
MSTADADAAYDAVLFAILLGVPLLLHVMSRVRAARAGLRAIAPNGTRPHPAALAWLGISFLAVIAGLVKLVAPEPHAPAWDAVIWGGAVSTMISAFAAGYTSDDGRRARRRKTRVKRDWTKRGKRGGARAGG